MERNQDLVTSTTGFDWLIDCLFTATQYQNLRKRVIMETLIQAFVSGLLLGGIYITISVGLSIIFGVLKVINFAHGEFIMIAMYATFMLFIKLHLDPLLSLCIVTPLMFLVGALCYKIFIDPVMGKSSDIQIFVTVGLLILLQNLALAIWGANYVSVRTPYSDSVITLGFVSISTIRLIATLVSALVLVGLYFLLHHTQLGRAIRAVSQDREAAAAYGINIKNIYMLTFGLGIALTGVGGGLLIPIFYAFPTVGTYFTLVAFVIVVLGGLGSISGAVVGSIIIGVVDTMSGYLLDPALKEAVYFIVFVAILLLKPSGLFGGRLKGMEGVGL